MRRKALLMMVFFIILGVSLSSDALAAIYKYVDKDGMIYFSDDLQSIPEQYRAAAKIVSGEAKEEEKRPVTHNQEKTLLETGMNNDGFPGVQQKPFSSRVLISEIIVVSAMFTLVILGILDTDHKKTVKIVRVVVLWGVSVYLLFAHAGDVVHVFSSMGKHVENVQRESEEKGKKAAKALKALDTLVEQAEKSSSPDHGGTEPEKKE